MRHLKKYNESISPNNMLDEIRKCSWVIEDRGYNIIYFVSVYTGHPDLYTYAIGSSNDRDIHTPSERVCRVFLEIVDSIPKKKQWHTIYKELTESGDLDIIINEFVLLFPEYKVSKSQEGRPIYIFFDRK